MPRCGVYRIYHRRDQPQQNQRRCGACWVHGGLIGSTLAGLIGAIVSALILAIVFGITSMIEKSIPLTVMQSLHIVGWLFALPLVLGVPKLVIKAKNKAATEQGGVGQPATRPGSK